MHDLPCLQEGRTRPLPRPAPESCLVLASRRRCRCLWRRPVSRRRRRGRRRRTAHASMYSSSATSDGLALISVSCGTMVVVPCSPPHRREGEAWPVQPARSWAQLFRHIQRLTSRGEVGRHGPGRQPIQTLETTAPASARRRPSERQTTRHFPPAARRSPLGSEPTNFQQRLWETKAHRWKLDPRRSQRGLSGRPRRCSGAHYASRGKC